MVALIAREIADGHVIADGVGVFEEHRKAGGEIAQDVLENQGEGTDQGAAGQQRRDWRDRSPRGYRAASRAPPA